jgi:hypothetical protein
VHGWGEEASRAWFGASWLGLFSCGRVLVVFYVFKKCGCVIASLIFGPHMSVDPVGDPPIFLLYNTMKRSSPAVSKKKKSKWCNVVPLGFNWKEMSVIWFRHKPVREIYSFHPMQILHLPQFPDPTRLVGIWTVSPLHIIIGHTLYKNISLEALQRLLLMLKVSVLVLMDLVTCVSQKKVQPWAGHCRNWCSQRTRLVMRFLQISSYCIMVLNHYTWESNQSMPDLYICVSN